MLTVLTGTPKTRVAGAPDAVSVAFMSGERDTLHLPLYRRTVKLLGEYSLSYKRQARILPRNHI